MSERGSAPLLMPVCPRTQTLGASEGLKGVCAGGSEPVVQLGRGKLKMKSLLHLTPVYATGTPAAKLKTPERRRPPTNQRQGWV